MKIRKKAKFITTNQSKKIWHVLIGISLKEQEIIDNKYDKPFQYIHIWNCGFIEEQCKNHYNILYRGVLTNRNQKVYIYVVNHKEIVNNKERKMYLFNKNAGNDIWECLYFSKEFQENKHAYIQTTDCKLQIKNIFYALIGSII